MCQIQIVKPLNSSNLTRDEVVNFANLLYWGSFHNSDSYGWYSDTQYHRSNEAFDYDKVIQELMKTKHKILIGHNRYKTKGDSKVMDNNHPFETQNFIVVHNGVLSNDETLKKKYDFEYEIETDSYIISMLLEHFYKVTNDVVKAIKSTAEEIYGSFSVLIYFKPENRVFYFKDKSTNFNFGLLKTNNKYTLYGSTDKDNLESINNEYLFGFFKMDNGMIISEPNEEVIYEIKDNEIDDIEKFSEKKYLCNDYGYSRRLTTGTSITCPDTIKGKFRQVAKSVEIRVFEDAGITPINRTYDYKRGVINFEFRQDDYPPEPLRNYVEDTLISWGDLEWVTVVGSKKFTLKFSPDFSQLQTEKDWEALQQENSRIIPLSSCSTETASNEIGLRQLLGD